MQNEPEQWAVDVREVETVTGDFGTEPGTPFYRIEIDGYCADFDCHEGAQNFANAIQAAFAEREARLVGGATPTCWLYRNSEGHSCVQFVQGLMDLSHWTEAPLYAGPPATDVAALVEALRPFITHNSSEEYTTISVRSSAIARARQALAPFTKGQNDG